MVDFANPDFAGAWLAAQACHGELGLMPGDFAGRIQCVREKHALTPDHPLYFSDLYLTSGCATWNEMAWQRFGDLYRPLINSLCDRAFRAAGSATDHAQNIFIDLYLPDKDGRPRIASYEGICSLSSWLRVVVSNRTVNERLRRDNRNTFLGDVAEPVDARALASIENLFTVRRYEPLAALALRDAFETLQPSERQILLWRFEQNLRLGEIAARVGVHQSNVTRQMEKAMRKVRAVMRERLTATYGLSAEGAEDCLDSMSDHLPETFSVIELLKRTEAGHSRPAAIGRGTALHPPPVQSDYYSGIIRI